MTWGGLEKQLVHKSTEYIGGLEAVCYKNRNMDQHVNSWEKMQCSRKASLVPLLCMPDRGGPVALTQKDANEGSVLGLPLYVHTDTARLCQGRCCGPGWTLCVVSCTTPVSYPPALICSALLVIGRKEPGPHQFLCSKAKTPYMWMHSSNRHVPVEPWVKMKMWVALEVIFLLVVHGACSRSSHSSFLC